jgi:hypothetical protein
MPSRSERLAWRATQEILRIADYGRPVLVSAKAYVWEQTALFCVMLVVLIASAEVGTAVL